MSSVFEDNPIDFYRQRARWFLLLGGLIGGILAVSAIVGMILEIWGDHMGGGSDENTQAIAWGLGVLLIVLAPVIVFLLWRARHHLDEVRRLDVETSSPTRASVPAPARSPRPPEARMERPRTQDVAASPHSLPVSPWAGRDGLHHVSASGPQPAWKVSQDADELVVPLTRPGTTLAEVVSALGRENVLIEDMWTSVGDGKELLHLIVLNASAARRTLSREGVRDITARRVLLVNIEEGPEETGRLFRHIEEAGAQVTSVRLLSKTRLVIISDELDKVRAVL